MKNNIITWFMLAAILLVSACKKEGNEDSPEKIKITEAISGDGLKAVLWADRQQLSEGHNIVYITLSDASGAINDQDVTIFPLMDMQTMQHSSPVEQPIFDEGLNMYSGAVVFTMPSSSMGIWTLKVQVGNRNVTLNLNIAEAAANTKPVVSFQGSDQVSYTVALVQPLSPKTGMNDIEVLISRRENMNSFPPVDDLSLVFRPEMTSMGHSSPNNMNPTSIGNGRYKGKVNFTMTGDWRLFFTLEKNGSTIVTDTYLDIIF